MRWIGAASLALALVMLGVGETLLRGLMPPIGLLFYYTVCMGLTAVAIAIALADARANARRTLQERRALLDSTIKNLQRDIQVSPDQPGREGRP